jgi:phage repressor protein C with HTH and peptisase S24 domain/DNA-binding XRE family transcriptional regulator
MVYPERIKIMRALFSMNQKEFALFLNTARSALSEFENGTREPSKDFILALRDVGVSLDWFLSGKGEPLLPEMAEYLKKPNIALKAHVDDEKIKEFRDEFRRIYRLNIEPITMDTSIAISSKNSLPFEEAGDIIEAAPEKGGPPGSTDTSARERNMTAAAERTETVLEAIGRRLPVFVEGGEQGVLIPVIGQGLSAGLGFDYDDGEVVRFIKIPAWIARKSRDLVALPIYGDSMEPTIGRGDLAVCDGGGFKDDGIYVLRDEERDLMFCKRVVWAPGGWTIKSDNPRYESMKVDDRAIQIVARVIAAIKEVK